MSGPLNPAGFWIRVLAALIDGLIFIPIVVVLFLDLFWWKSFFVIVLLSIPSVVYKPFMESTKGATLGKMACGLRVVDEHGSKISLERAYLRSLPNLVALFVGLISYILLFSNPEFLTAKTLVDFLQIRQPAGMNGASFASEFFILLDGLVVVLNVEKRAIHDYLANSYCVYAQKLAESTGVAAGDATACATCGKEIPDGSRYCPHCGNTRTY